jgi:hypothetical protein
VFFSQPETKGIEFSQFALPFGASSSGGEQIARHAGVTSPRNLRLDFIDAHDDTVPTTG